MKNKEQLLKSIKYAILGTIMGICVFGAAAGVLGVILNAFITKPNIFPIGFWGSFSLSSVSLFIILFIYDYWWFQ